MKILITGGDGFVGSHVANRLCELGGLGEGHEPMTRLTLVSRRFQRPPQDARVRLIEGDIVSRDTLFHAVEGGVDCVFHLASMPSGDAQRNFDTGRRVNLEATLSLFEVLRSQPRAPVVVFSSSIAVYGNPYPKNIDDETLPLPVLSYGAQKLIGEILIADYSKRGFLDGRAIRLPGIVARPRNNGGAFSLFLSNIFHAFADGDAEFTCPISAKATPWLMSVQCCVENVIHAARIPTDALGPRRAWMIPTLRVALDDLAHTLVDLTGSKTRVVYNPTEPLETNIGRLPAVLTPLADSLGFRHDGSVRQLCNRVLETIEITTP